jgi:hypothetical protein
MEATYLALRAADEDPGDLGLDDPDDDPPPDVDPGDHRRVLAVLAYLRA